MWAPPPSRGCPTSERSQDQVWLLSSLPGGWRTRKVPACYGAGACSGGSGPHWYLGTLILIPTFVVVGTLTLPGAATSYTGTPPLQIIAAFLARFVLFGFIGGPLAEEPGWRGFALPLLQSRYNQLNASLLLGTVWALWHLPLFMTASEGGGPGVSHAHVILLFAQFVRATLAFTLVLTWLFNRTHGSLVLAMSAHAALNASTVFLVTFPTSLVAHSNLPILIGMGTLGLIVLAATRGHLGVRCAHVRTDRLVGAEPLTSA